MYGTGTAAAQQEVQWLPGFAGLNAGVMADPDFVFTILTFNYSADSKYMWTRSRDTIGESFEATDTIIDVRLKYVF